MAIREESIELVVPSLATTLRLDVFITQHSELSRTIFSRPDTRIIVNGAPAKKSYRVQGGDRVRVIYTQERFEGLVAQPIDLCILYEDSHLIVVDKEQGMVVHPGAGNWDNTLVNALLSRYGTTFAQWGDTLRPGIVHRLDKDTSGVLAVALQQQSHRSLSEQFAARTVERVYIALVEGRFTQRSGTIRQNIKRHPSRRKEFITCSSDEGRDAHTDWQVIEQYPHWALLRIVLYTGRTHQIRVHMRSIGHPIVGDSIYGTGGPRPLMLHALVLGFDHPHTDERMRVVARIPTRFMEVMGRSDR